MCGFLEKQKCDRRIVPQKPQGLTGFFMGENSGVVDHFDSSKIILKNYVNLAEFRDRMS